MKHHTWLIYNHAVKYSDIFSGTLRNISTTINSELDEQAVMLDEFGAEIEQAETKLDATMRKMVSSYVLLLCIYLYFTVLDR